MSRPWKRGVAVRVPEAWPPAQPAPPRRTTNVAATLLGHALAVALPLALGAMLAWLILWAIAEGWT